MYERQDLLIPQIMKSANAYVVGCGMLGSWTVQSLARTMKSVTAIDFDKVGTENIGTQSYDFRDVGINKAEALKRHLDGFEYSPLTEALTEDFRVLYNTLETNIVISAVDSFEARAMVARWAIHMGAELFIDTRAEGTVGCVVTVVPPLMDHYLATLERDEDTSPPACGAEGTAFVGLWVAAQVTSSIVRVARGMSVPFKVVHDMGFDVRLLTETEVPMTQQS